MNNPYIKGVQVEAPDPITEILPLLNKDMAATAANPSVLPGDLTDYGMGTGELPKDTKDYSEYDDFDILTMPVKNQYSASLQRMIGAVPEEHKADISSFLEAPTVNHLTKVSQFYKDNPWILPVLGVLETIGSKGFSPGTVATGIQNNIDKSEAAAAAEDQTKIDRVAKAIEHQAQVQNRGVSATEDLGAQTERLLAEFKKQPSIMQQAKAIAQGKMNLADAKIPGFGSSNKMANTAFRALVFEIDPNFNPNQVKYDMKTVGSVSGDYGTQKKNVSFANHAQTLVQQAIENAAPGQKYNMPKPQLADLITSTVKMLGGGQISDSQREDIMLRTAQGDIATFWNYLGLTAPTNATTDDLIDLYAEMSSRQGEISQRMVDSYESKAPIKAGGLRFNAIDVKKVNKKPTIDQTIKTSGKKLSSAEAQALPKGTHFIGMDGKEYIR